MGGERGYIYLCFWNARCVSFLSSSFSAIISVFCYSQDIWWIRPRERWVAKKFERRFFFLFFSLLFISFSFRIVVQVWVKNFCSFLVYRFLLHLFYLFSFFFLFLFKQLHIGVSIFNVIIATNWEIICNYRVLIFVQLYVGISFFQTVVKF